MANKASSEMSRVEKVRQWIREERELRGWGATRLAQEACLAAQKRGEVINLKQQSISAMELGYIKSVPAWIKHVADAFGDNPVPATMQNIQNMTSFECKTSNKTSLPNEDDLKRVLLGLLAPVEESISWDAKQRIAGILAQKLPMGLEQIRLFK
ncbi:hypothetical protein [Zymomonas mobilis]|uniref:hypothetical protein n=1 Tax=Zymomonas mobilis TaxID=542 RepID=UPI001CD01213|nr:hypothetical protein [Zymomonas mobilis]UBQ08769.1 hypothetical protein LB319_09795 [Zymomonas mobilis]